MNIELKELCSEEGYMLKFGGFHLMFRDKQEANAFVQVLKGRIEAVRFHDMSGIGTTEEGGWLNGTQIPPPVGPEFA